MSVTDIYSKRRKRHLGEVPDVYQYADIPMPMRVQIIHIWRSSLGDAERHNEISGRYNNIHNKLCREYGLFELNPGQNGYHKLKSFLLSCTEIDKVLDVVELSFQTLLEFPALFGKVSGGAITELNQRFREHAIGYQFASGEIVRVDFQLIHSSAVLPALQLLGQPIFHCANIEFLTAHEHYRHGRTKECLIECLKALESTIKIICTKRNWSFKTTDTAKPLIDIVFSNNLLPSHLQSHFSGLRSTLEGGVPTVRNKFAGHGQGPIEVNVPSYLASYVLHLTASNILLLAQADEALL